VVAGRVLVWPAWREARPPAFDGVVVLLDPGAAFGSGAHESTRLALVELQRFLAPGDRVLDVGCGSGVLAVAAALLGAGEVDGVDVDPEAMSATARNAEANGVTVGAECRSVEARDRGYDLVLANIGAAVLIGMAEEIVAAMAPAGRVVLAGMLAAGAADTRAAFVARGLTVLRAEELDGWSMLVMGRPDSSG
jgi:ribosomal protein L11 methyltransferase